MSPLVEQDSYVWWFYRNLLKISDDKVKKLKDKGGGGGGGYKSSEITYCLKFLTTHF